MRKLRVPLQEAFFWDLNLYPATSDLTVPRRGVALVDLFWGVFFAFSMDFRKLVTPAYTWKRSGVHPLVSLSVEGLVTWLLV